MTKAAKSEPGRYYPRAVRSEVLAELRDMSYRLHGLISLWAEGARVYDGVLRHTTGSGSQKIVEVCQQPDPRARDGGVCRLPNGEPAWHVTWRPREAHEYAENRVTEWDRLGDRATELAERFQRQATAAYRRAESIKRVRAEGVARAAAQTLKGEPAAGPRVMEVRLSVCPQRRMDASHYRQDGSCRCGEEAAS